MFFEPKVYQKETPVALNKSAVVTGEGYAKKVSEKLLAEWGTDNGTIQSIRFSETLPEDLTVPAGEETYALIITQTQATLYGTTERARIYAAVTLKQLCDHKELCTGRIEDTPDCSYRGYRAYLPGRNSFQLFYDTVDLLAYYKYNYLSLEIGGAMEYKRHPEINQGDPERLRLVQKLHPYRQR